MILMGGRARFHGPDLHGRGLGAQKDVRRDVEGVLDVPGGVVRRRVEGLEVVVGVLHLGAGSHGVPHGDENLLDLAAHAGHRVKVAQLGPQAGEGHIQPRGSALGVPNPRQGPVNPLLQVVFEGVHGLPEGRPILRRHLLEGGHELLQDAALLPRVAALDIQDIGFGSGSRNLSLEGVPDLVEPALLHAPLPVTE